MTSKEITFPALVTELATLHGPIANEGGEVSISREKLLLIIECVIQAGLMTGQMSDVTMAECIEPLMIQEKK